MTPDEKWAEIKRLRAEADRLAATLPSDFFLDGDLTRRHGDPLRGEEFPVGDEEFPVGDHDYEEGV